VLLFKVSASCLTVVTEARSPGVGVIASVAGMLATRTCVLRVLVKCSKQPDCHEGSMTGCREGAVRLTAPGSRLPDIREE
jgi:hypothetical protein